MARPSVSQRRAAHIIERAGGRRVRRGEADRLEVGHGGLFEQTEGTRTLRVGGTLAESTGGTHTTRAKRIERTVRGHTRVKARTDNIILGGGMSEVHAGAEVVLAGMSDDLVIGAGTRATALIDLWVAGLLGIEEKLATSNFDGAFIDTARTLFEREYGTGVHHAASASFSGAVYATQATGFRKYMKVASGVRNLSSGGGGGGGDESASASGPSTPAASPGTETGSGLLGSAQAPGPGAAGIDSADVGRLAGEVPATEDAAHYARVDNVADTTASMQDAARGQVAGDSPDEAVRAPSRADSAQGPSAGSSPGGIDAADPVAVSPEGATPTRPAPSRMEPEWHPSTTHERTYTNNQVRIGDSFEEFRFDRVVGERPDKLLSDDAQAAMDTGAFRHMYQARDEVTDMARESVRLADMQRPPPLRLEPDTVNNMTAVQAHEYLARLQDAAVQANDTEEARRLQDLINGLEHYAFDRYTTALADAELVHMQTPAKLPANVDADALVQRLTALGEEQMALADSRHLSDEERHHAGKLSMMYMLAAQDTMQGLDPLVHIQEMMNSGLDKADAALYTELASGVSNAMFPGVATAAPPASARSLWARAGEIANGLLAAFRRWDPRPGNAIAHVDQVPETPGPIRFLDSPPGRPPAAAADVPPGAPARSVKADTGTVTGATGSSSAGSGSSRARPSTGLRGLPSGEGASLNPTLDADGARWKEPAVTREGAGAAPWADPP